MKILYTLIILLLMPVFAMAEVFPRTIYAITPEHITYKTLHPNQYISLYAIGNDAYKHQDIGIKNKEEIQIKIVEYVQAKRGKRNGYYKIQYSYNNNTFDGKMKISTPKDIKDIAHKAGITIVGHILKVPGFSQALAVSKGLLNPNEDETRIKTAGKNLYESTPLTYAERGDEFSVEEDGIVVLKLKVKDDCEE